MHTVLVIWAAVAFAGAAGARLPATGTGVSLRVLSQSDSGTNTRCPVGCAEGSCVMDASAGGYKCIKCINNLVVDEANGRCSCPAGRYATDNGRIECQDCKKGSYCLGGSFTPDTAPGKADCGSGLTTTGMRSVSLKSCVNVPGTAFKVDASGSPSSITCPADTYGPGLKKQRACVPCPPGYTTKGLTGKTTARDCFVSEGYFLKGPGQVAPCPKGEYKSGFSAASICDKCPTGTTTLQQASKSAADCKAVLPGWYPSRMNGSYVTAAERCPQKYYCRGGVPTAIFSPTEDQTSDVTGTTVVQCPYGTWTENIASTSADQCMTPPGYKTTITGDSGTTDPCQDGEYRPEWKPAVAAATCLSCGAGIYSNPIEQITRYASTPDATPVSVDVRAGPASCYIKAGQGMYYSPASQAFYASNCDFNNFGAPNITYGLSAFPCRDCSVGLVANTVYASSAAYFQLDNNTSPARGGFVSPMACVTQPGFGYNGRTASKCPVGTYNPPGTLTSCAKCAFGLSTRDDAESQVSAGNCTLAAGFGFHSNSIVPCPIGTYNALLQNDTTSPCVTCPTGFTTSQTGGTSLRDCNLCLPGYGDSGNNTDCGAKCGGENGANFGPAGRDALNHRCTNCPAGGTKFSFDYMADNMVFIPDSVARIGADSPADCLAEFAQILDDTWFLGGETPLNNVTNATTFDDCVLECKDDASCMYVTFSYDGSTCQKKVAAGGSDVLAFKAVVPGEDTSTSAQSTGAVRGSALASGAYTFWKTDAFGIGADNSTSGAITSIQACLTSCDKDGQCAAVVMKDVTSAGSVPTTCTMLKGDLTPATFKRSVTKAVTTRLDVSSLFAAP